MGDSRKTYVISLAFVTALSQITLFYLLFTTNNLYDYFLLFLFPNTSYTQVSLIAALIPIGAVCTLFLAPLLNKKIGKKWSLIIADAISLLGIGLCMVENFPTIAVGRLIQGLAVGINYVIIPLYLAEMAPGKLGKEIYLYNMIAFPLGTVIAGAFGFFAPRPADGDDWSWRFMLAFSGIFNIIRMLMLLTIFRYPSPVKYLEEGKINQSEAAMKRIFKTNHQEHFNEMQKQELLGKEAPSFKEVFKAPYHKPMVFANLLLVIQQGSGFANFLVYPATLFAETDPGDGNITRAFCFYLTLVNFFGGVVAVLALKRRLNRQILLFFGVASMLLLELAYILVAAIDASSALALRYIAIWWPFFYQISVGTVGPFYLYENVPFTGKLLTGLTDWISIFVSTITYFPTIDWLGVNKVLIPNTGFCLAGLIIILFFYIDPVREKKTDDAERYQNTVEGSYVQPSPAEGLPTVS